MQAELSLDFSHKSDKVSFLSWEGDLVVLGYVSGEVRLIKINISGSIRSFKVLKRIFVHSKKLNSQFCKTIAPTGSTRKLKLLTCG